MVRLVVKETLFTSCIRIAGKHTYTYYYMHTFCTCIVQKFNKAKVFCHLIIITVQVVVDDTVIHKLKQRFNDKAKIEYFFF